MSAAAWLWIRRGGVGLWLIAGVSVVLVAVFSRSHWTADLDIALEWANGSTLLLSPLTGAVAAFTVWRDYPRELQALTRTAQRGARTVLHIGAAVWSTAVLAWLVGVVVVVIGVWAAGGALAADDPWVLAAGPAVLFPAAMLGALAAVAVRSLAVAPTVGVLVYLLAVWTYPLRTPALLAVGGPTGTRADLRPIPEVVAADVLLNVMVGVWLACLVWRAGTVRRATLVDVVAFLALAGAVALLVAFAQRDSLDTHYVADEVVPCGGARTEACADLRGSHEVEAVAAQPADGRLDPVARRDVRSSHR